MGTRKDNDRYSQNQRYEVVLDNGERQDVWSDLFGTVVNVASGTNHVTGSQSISFDKSVGDTRAYMIRPIDRSNGFNLDAFSTEGHILTSVYFPDLSDVASMDICLSMSSGIDNAVLYRIADTDLSSGWNHLKFDCCDFTAYYGAGVDWSQVKYLVFGVNYDSAGDTDTDVLVDSIRMQLPTATLEFDPTINNLIAQSEVKLKDLDDEYLDLQTADTVSTTSTIVVPVQHIDEAGQTQPAGDANARGVWSRIGDGTNAILLSAANTARAAADIVLSTQHIDEAGEVLKSLATAAQAGFVKLTDGTIDLSLKRADTAPTVATSVVPIQHMDEAGKTQPAGDDPARAIYMQGANYTERSGVITFGDPGASPAHSTPLDENFNAATAQGEAIAIAAPTPGKSWQRLQMFLRWTTAPAAPVAATPDLVIVLYWHDGSAWQEPIYYPAKWLTDTDTVADLQTFGSYTELPFPARATQFAVGVAGYVDGELYVDLEGVA